MRDEADEAGLSAAAHAAGHGAAAAHANGTAGAAAERRRGEVLSALRTVGHGLAALEDVASQEARAVAARAAGYAGLQANLSLVAREIESLSPEKEHRRRLSDTLSQMQAQIERLSRGAAGEARRQLELSLEEEGTRMLQSLKLMSAGQRGEGCVLFGILEVPRVSGQVRISPATSDAAQVGGGGGPRQPGSPLLPGYHVRHALYFNVSHVIRHLSFGTYFPGMHNPLDNTSKHSAEGAAEARYLIKVVPSAYSAINGSVTLSNLFSVTEHFHPLHWHSGQHQLPGVFLSYDISGMKVTFTEQHGASISGAVARICALVGGVMTVASIVDKVVYQSSVLLLKNRMGKQS